MPLGQWLKGPLKGWADNLINPARLNESKIFNPEPIYRKWKEHIDEKAQWDAQLWPVLMFQTWIQKVKSS
jgi:asparagine synthase (glutamine-hydrolysing)